jgi:hypothetical protein
MSNAPFHIQVIGKFYKPIDSESNLADGRIRHFQFVEDQRNIHRMGDRVTSTEMVDGKSHSAIWVHLAQDYFKLIGLWLERTC